MSRDARLLEGHGFAVFTRDSSFAVSTVARYLDLDKSAKHVVYIHHDATERALTRGLGAACGVRGVDFHPLPWAEYGDPAVVRAIAEFAPENLVFVSADHHLSVHDRLDKRRGYIRRKAARKKIALDTIPYEVQPWRIYFPFGFFDLDLLGYHHSYAIEQDHERFLDGQLAEDPCDPVRIAAKTWRGAVVDAPAYFTRRPTVQVLEASRKHHGEYTKVRDRLFDQEKSIAGVKRSLAAWIQERYPERAIPADLKQVYAPDFAHVVHTDLPFDRWLMGEITGLMDHTDKLLGLYAWHQQEAGE